MRESRRSVSAVELKLTREARARYDRIAPLYDAAEAMMERRFKPWRQELWAGSSGPRVLELGVGTGKSIPFYPEGVSVTAIDFSPRMLERARRKAAHVGSSVALQVADAQALPFESGSFDEVVATCLFCSVPDPLQGLREARRVLKPGGRLLLLEHVLSCRPVLRRLMRWLDPIPFRLWGAHIDRETIATIKEAGFVDVQFENKVLDVVALIRAQA